MSAEPDRDRPPDDSPAQPRTWHLREGVARGEAVVHSGCLDLVAVVVLAAALYVADSSDEDLGSAQFVLATALWIFGIRGFLRLCVFFKNT